MSDMHHRAYLEAMEIPFYVSRDQSRPDGVSVESEGDPLQDSVLASNGAKPSSDSFDRLRAEVQSCTACELATSRTQTVLGVGNEQADLLVIGEAPGADEDRQGEPFVGRAGQLLNGMLKAIGLTREQVYIANILKCRPPGNRNPTVGEAAACQRFLDRQIALIQPRIVLSLGGVSAHNLLKSDESVGRLRQRLHSCGEKQIPLLVTYHPAYLLRRPEEKAKVWQDMQKLSRILNS